MTGEPQHVMVTTTNVWADVEAHGLLLEWRQVDGKWEALACWAEPYSGGWTMRQRWVAAEQVRAVGGDA
jgi:hypothetical protein